MYNEYQPSLLLAPYIDKYWEFKGNPDYGMKINILPVSYTHLINPDSLLSGKVYRCIAARSVEVSSAFTPYVSRKIWKE